MIFGSNLLSIRLTVTIFLLPLIYSSAIPENISTDQIFANSGYFRNTSSRIADGKFARLGQFPFQVSIRYIPNTILAGLGETHFCEGAILNSWWVLTAGDCVFRYRQNLIIVAGNLKLKYSFNSRHVRHGIKFLNHEINYGMSKKMRFDIGLIKVHQEWNFSTPYVKPIEHLDYSLPPDYPCTISGWGNPINIFYDRWPNERKLEYSEEFLYNNYFCNTKIPAVKKIRDFIYLEEVLCAGNLGVSTGPCGGDIGGPLVCDGRLAGVYLFNVRNECTGQDVPNVYLNVTFFWWWIEASISPSKTHTLHIASTTFFMVNLILILYCLIVYV